MAAPLDNAAAPAASARRSWRQRVGPFVRPVLAVELASSEIVMFSLLLEVADRAGVGIVTSAWARPLQVFLIAAALATAVLLWPRRAELVALLGAAQYGTRWWVAVASNLLGFGVAVHATVQLVLATGVPGGGFPVEALVIGLAGGALAVASLVALAAPLAVWRRTIKGMPTEVLLGLSIGFVAATVF